MTKVKNVELRRGYVDPCKVAIFQEAARYYGVHTLPEITVLPTHALFVARRLEALLNSLNCNNSNIGYADFIAKAQGDFESRQCHGIRIAERMPLLPKLHIDDEGSAMSTFL